MTNKPHVRPPKRQVFTRTLAGSVLPAIPLPYYTGLGTVRCHQGDCRKRFWTVKRYRRHFVLAHVYGEVLDG
jgi:hypothetical protein